MNNTRPHSPFEEPVSHAESGRGDPSIRPALASDLPSIKAVIDAVGLFPSEMLDDMLSGYLNVDRTSSDLWIVDDDGGRARGVAYYAPERMTSGTWNVYLIAVHPDHQRRGRGSALMRYIEQDLAAREARVVLVETSGLPAFERTRGFYDQLQYSREAVIRDFYQHGEDKVIFRKAIRTAAARHRV